MKYEQLLSKYSEIDNKIKELEQLIKPLKEEKDEIRRNFAELLHARKTNKLIMESSDGVPFKMYYRKGPSKIDMVALTELIGLKKIESLTSQTEYLMISKPSKSDLQKIDNDKLFTAPVKEEESFEKGLPPIGKLM